MNITRRPTKLCYFVNPSISLSVAEYKALIVSSLSQEITVDIYSDWIAKKDRCDLPEKKTITTTLEYVLLNAVPRVSGGNVYYTVDFHESSQLPTPAVKKTQYIVFEGGEGVGKSTQAAMLYDYLTDSGYSCLLTKEPGTEHLALTMELRKIMLDAQYENQITPLARELLCQSIRSIHIDKLINPAVASGEYDFIIQDRGILSSLAYGTACGHDPEWLIDSAKSVAGDIDIYSKTIHLTGSVDKGLQKALTSKQEFAAGDAIEAKGVDFLNQVSDNFNNFSSLFNTDTIYVDNKEIVQVFEEVLAALKL